VIALIAHRWGWVPVVLVLSSLAMLTAGCQSRPAQQWQVLARRESLQLEAPSGVGQHLHRRCGRPQPA
jgi:hypothetical protein